MDKTFEVDPDHEDARRETSASDLIRLACLWVAAGALYKLFAGSPGDLPQLVRDQSPLGPAGTFRAAISIELTIVILCLFRPRLGWFWLVALFGVFDSVLWPLVQAGEASCGCFGGTITIKPLYMLIIDSVLLVGVIFGRPWSAIPKRPLQPLILLPLIGAAIWAPFHLFKDSPASVPPPRPAIHQPSSATPAAGSGAGAKGAKQIVPAVQQPAGTGDAAPAGAGLEEPAARDPEQATTSESGAPPAVAEQPAAPAGWAPISPLPEWHSFDVASWEGQTLFDIDAGNFVDFEQFPDSCHVVFYRQTCEHCAAHLEELAIDPPAAPLVLVRLVETNDSEQNKVTHVIPETPFLFEMPALRRGYDMTTPVSMDVERYVISNVQERAE